MSVYLYVVHNVLTFESLDVEKNIFGLRIHIQAIRVKFIYEGHRVKVKVAAAKTCTS